MIVTILLNTAWMDLPYLSNNPHPVDILTTNIQKKAAQEISKKYDLQPCGTTASMPNGVLKMLGIHFAVYRPLTKEEARRLLLKSAQDLLEEINSYPELAEYAPVFPFKIENIEITINCHDHNGSDTFDPYIGFAVIRNGKLIYRIYEKNGEKMKFEERESYEKALEMSQSK